MDLIVSQVRTSRERQNGGVDEELVLRQTRHTKELETPLQLSRHVLEQQRSQDVIVDLDALLVFLRSEPEIDTLTAVLRVVSSAKPDDSLYLYSTTPRSAQVIKCLVDVTAPTFWPALSTIDRSNLALSLRSLGGINAILTSLRISIRQTQTAKTTANASQTIAVWLTLLGDILLTESKTILTDFWTRLQALPSSNALRGATWQEVVILFGSGRISSITAEAEDSLKDSSHSVAFSLARGPRYAEWLSAQIVQLAHHDARPYETRLAASAQVLSKSLSIGYTQDIVNGIVMALGQSAAGMALLPLLLKHLQTPYKQSFLQSLVVWLSKIFRDPAAPSELLLPPTSMQTAAVAGLFAAMNKEDEALAAETVALLQSASSTATFSFMTRRAVISAVASTDLRKLSTLLSQVMTVFGDQLFIAHSPLSQHDAIAQTILLSAGHVYRLQPQDVVRAARSSQHMQGVSNRLGASSDRARWLGMIVGTGISRLVDSGVTKMDFGIADMHTPEALAYLNLINIADDIGDPNRLPSIVSALVHKSIGEAIAKPPGATTMPIVDGKQTFGPLRPPPTKSKTLNGQRVTELLDEEVGEDDDMKPYAKPDSDPEDSDEDSTLVNRKRARPPVYIRSLMSMLRDNENAESFQLAVKHAAGLIRRKTGHGREVSDHAEELARMLAHLQDPFETEDFDTSRLQALVALLLSDVNTIGPWACRQAFTSDYSIAQRMLLLTALGLSGRELAGLQSEDNLNLKLPGAAFPSKKLPAHLHAIYDREAKAERALDHVSRSVEQSLIQPMALKAADQTTSQLDVFKVRTFSSRMEVERTKRKPVANSLAKVFKQAYFDPLLTSFQADFAAYQDSSVFASTSVLLAAYIKTLAVLLNAAGPATLEIPQITSDMWTLLLFLRVKALGHSDVLESILLCLLTLFDVNTDHHRLATEHPQQLFETKEWVEMVFDRTGGGRLVQEEGKGEDSRLRSLSAAVLTKASEIIERYQKALIGHWTDF